MGDEKPETQNWWKRLSTPKKLAIGAVVTIFAIAAFQGEPVEDSTTTAKAKPVARTAATPEAKAEQALEKALNKQYGRNATRKVECSKTLECTASARVGIFRNEDGLAREIGNGFERAYKDTDIEYLKLNALSETIDNLGNEQKDDQVGFMLASREQWSKVNWENLRYMDGLVGKLRVVSDSLAITVKF